MSLACGTYNLSGSFSSGYEFSSWSNSGGSIANRNTLSTRYTVNGPGTITLTGKSVPTMKNFTAADCQSQASNGNVTVVDSRDNNSYTVRYINGACWMTQNLRLSGGRTLTSADSNVASSWYFPNTSLTSGSSYTDARSVISSKTSYGGYYNFCAVSAGTDCASYSASNITYDICPADGDCQLSASKVILPAMPLFFRKSSADTTTVVPHLSMMVSTATGGRLLHGTATRIPMATIFCQPLLLLYYILATSAKTVVMDTRCGVSALASRLWPSPDIHGEPAPRPGGGGGES